MLGLVKRMLELNKQKHVRPPSQGQGRGRQDAGATVIGKLVPSELDRLERDNASTGREIDADAKQR